MISVLFAVALAAVPAPPSYPVEVLWQSGPPANRIDVVVLGDGYRAQDQAQLTQDAKQLLDVLFGYTPFQQYRGLFSAKLIHVESVDRGADNGTYTPTLRNTALGTYYKCFNIDRLLCVDTSAVLTIAAQHVPEYDLAIVIVNDPKFGGSGGEVPVVSLALSARQALGHELAHTLGNLADEYEDPYPGYPPCSPIADCREPNATLRNVRSAVKWSMWINPTTPVPTPENAGHTGIGVFEGGRYLSTGVYRPKESECLMRNPVRSFCSVCSEALVRQFWTRVKPIDAVSPLSSAWSTTCTDANFTVSTPSVSPATWSWLWTIDGTPQIGGSTLKIPAGSLAVGRYKVAVTLRDTTLLVRNDPNNLLTDTTSWVLDVLSCSADGGADAAPDRTPDTAATPDRTPDTAATPDRTPDTAAAPDQTPDTAPDRSSSRDFGLDSSLGPDAVAKLDDGGSPGDVGESGESDTEGSYDISSGGCSCTLTHTDRGGAGFGLCALFGLVWAIRKRRGVHQDCDSCGGPYSLALISGTARRKR